MIAALAMAVALGIDAVIGWPAWLFARIGHPVTWIGHLVRILDKRLNREGDAALRRRGAGIATLVIVVAAAAGAAGIVSGLLPGGVAGMILTGILAWPLVAARSLHDHVQAVATPLASGDLAAARGAVAMIVGRDPSVLDTAGVARAALESLAENTSDGIVAPLFWGAILGLPGIAAYKAVNTLDSMIGHKTPRYVDFGWASARFDDLVNLIPARASGILYAACSPLAVKSVRCMFADAGKHRSPNAGWPEAAMAGGLGIRLSGPRIYADGVANEPWVNGTAPDPGAQDLHRGLALYRRAMVTLGFLLGIVGLLACTSTLPGS